MSTVKIVSDGTLNGTQLVDSSGVPIGNVMAIYWFIKEGEDPIAHIKLRNVPVELSITEENTEVVFEEVEGG